jgi:hypothetical protein
VPGNNNGGEEFSCRFYYGALCTKSSNISALKKCPIAQKVTPKKGHHNLVSKVTFAFWVFAPRALEEDPPPIPIAIPNDEIKNVIGKTTVTAAIASERSIVNKYGIY